MDEKQVIQLLKQVRTIDDAYKIVKQNTGEDFNVFSILGMERKEVKTHSKFLAELLNPKGSHDQGDTFLKLFIHYLNTLEVNEITFLEDKIDIISDESQVEVEKYIGKINDEYGGRIDISIADNKGNFICIENKIDAGEQDKQMIRYDNFANKFTKKHLFFLTLRGNTSTSADSRKVYSISYEKHIIEWLELCKKEAVNLPILREGIGQYINLIKKLTHQTTNKKMEQNLNKIILENYPQSILIYQNFERAVFSIYNNVISIIEKKLRKELEENYSEWELHRVGKLNSINDRGNLFIKPKKLKEIGCFGIEEFNPLCKNNHFNHRIFFGIIKWDRNLKFLDIAKDLNQSNHREGWINYEFPKSEKIDFSLSTNILIDYIINNSKEEELAEEVFTNFISYFKKYQKEFLHYLNDENLNLDKDFFGENKPYQLKNVDEVFLYEFFKSKISINEFSNLNKVWVWSSNDGKTNCLVVSFSDFRFDFLLYDSKFFVQIIDINKTSIKNRILAEDKYMLLENGRYEVEITGENILEIIKSLKEKIKEIDELLDLE